METEKQPVVGFVLLSSRQWDDAAFGQALGREWNIQAKTISRDGSAVYDVGDMTVATSYIDMPVPEGEAENAAKRNFTWSHGAEKVKKHVAHLMLCVLGGERAVDRAQLFTMAAATALGAKNALALYKSPTVYSAVQYIDEANAIRSGALPVADWVYVGLAHSGETLCGYTVGMQYFGYDEMEIVRSSASAGSIYGLLLDVAAYVISRDIVLRDGETLGFSQEQRLSIRRSDGFCLEGKTLKIGL